MDKMKKLALLVVSACFMTTPVFASGGGVDLASADIDPDNINSLQRGAGNFMNYCSGCHSAQYVRYKTIAKDLDLSEEMLVDNLMFNAEKTFETIQASTICSRHQPRPTSGSCQMSACACSHARP